MTKFRLQISVLALSWCSIASAQTTYSIQLVGADKDPSVIIAETGIQTKFPSRSAAADYINKLPAYLHAKGYVTASIDSLHYDSTFARMVLFTGQLYRWAALDVRNVDAPLLDAVGWREKIFAGKPIDFNQVQVWQEKLLNQLENTGYPFAKVYLDSVYIYKESGSEVVAALLKINKGPLYKIDSLRVYGDAKISSDFLQRYLQLPNGTIYSREKLINVNKKIRELTYIEEEKPADLSMLGTGSVLNLYLKQKKSSQVNVIIGFLPNNNQLSSKKTIDHRRRKSIIS